MHIVLVVPSLGAGGAERVASTLVNAWAKAGERVTVMTVDIRIGDFYSLDSRIERVTLDLARDSESWFQFIRNNVSRVKKLRSAIQASAPDVVVSFIERTNVLVLLATRGLGIPVVVEEHIDPRVYPIGKVAGWLRRLVYPRAHAVVVLTSSVADWARSIAGRAQVHVIPNPVGDQFLKHHNGVRGEDRYTAVAMGRMVAQKGFDMLLRAFAQCASSHPEWNLRIVGQGSERQRLNELVGELGLRDRVTLEHVVKEPEKILQASDLFVLSSRYEGFPMVLLEAMASGLPVVSFDCPSGPSEMIRQGVDGVLVPPNDVDALAAALDRLMAAKSDRQRMGARAKEVIDRFGLPTVMARWSQVLNTAVSAK
jgi:GalNAc-alpha-(1->4)-GalNAc-alpha-(1->3)-diNAcBac-PP-undecaprenol alpha-1,4-N-acetyl-D-galactosaminyltransferase